MDCESAAELAQETLDNASETGGIVADEAHAVIYPLMRLILKGNPVALDTLDDRSERPREKIVSFLELWGPEYNEEGEIVGAGLSLESTPHEYQVEGDTFYTWCAPDALLYPKVLGHTARVVSLDPVSEQEITLTVSPDGVDEFSPSGTVVSWTREANGRDIRGSFCRYGRFFAGRSTAREWKEQHPKIEILDVREALDAIREMDALFRSAGV